jgi:hypothetical protein
MPLVVFALKLAGGVGITVSGAILVTKVLIDTGVIIP